VLPKVETDAARAPRSPSKRAANRRGRSITLSVFSSLCVFSGPGAGRALLYFFFFNVFSGRDSKTRRIPLLFGSAVAVHESACLAGGAVRLTILKRDRRWRSIRADFHFST